MRRGLHVSLLAVAGCLLLSSSEPYAQSKDDAAWTTTFGVETSELTPTGRNPYFILEPGHQSVFENRTERLTITVLNETKTVAGVNTRVVEERQMTRAGQPVEISRNYFAISTKTSSVFYFGEDVDIYSGGKVTSHEGAWLAGVTGFRFGLAMPGQILIGGRYYQEIAPKVAMDRAQVISLSETVTTPAGEFKNCLKVEETTPLEPGAREYKYYAPGTGLVRDGDMTLVKSGRAGG